MKDFLIAQLAVLLIFAVVIAILLRWRWLRIHGGWLSAFLLAFMTYFVVLSHGNAWLAFMPAASELGWNWGGKFASVLYWVLLLGLLLRLKPGFQPADAGITLRQRPGSLRPVLWAMAGFIILQVVLTLLFPNTGKVDAETLLFQALMPGLDEEPLFRGLLLYIASLALVGRVYHLLGARLNTAGLLLVMLFGLVHGIVYQGGEWRVSLLSIALTGFYGLVLLWMRERSGSLLMPIITHNAVNLTAFLV